LSSKNYLGKHKNCATLETWVELETEGLEVVQTHLSTLLTGSSEEEVFATLIPKAYLDDDVIIIPFQNDFSKGVVNTRYSELINSTYKLISNFKSYEIKYVVIKN
jgi:hypothetical protein